MHFPVNLEVLQFHCYKADLKTALCKRRHNISSSMQKQILRNTAVTQETRSDIHQAETLRNIVNKIYFHWDKKKKILSQMFVKCLVSSCRSESERSWWWEEAAQRGVRWPQRLISVELEWRTRAAGRAGQNGAAGQASCVSLGRFSGPSRVAADCVWWSGEPAGCFL